LDWTQARQVRHFRAAMHFRGLPTGNPAPHRIMAAAPTPTQQQQPKDGTDRVKLKKWNAVALWAFGADGSVHKRACSARTGSTP
jgi:hypothetical protein